MKGGAALAIPSGYYGPSYGKPHHAQWTRSTRANNCILVNNQGQKIRSAAANGKILSLQDASGYTYVTGDATPAYMGKLKKWIRHILFLRPGLFLLLDEIEASTNSQYQWMLHAFEKMDIKGKKIISRRKGATLEVYLECAKGLKLSQTDKFDTPYNYGIPESYHKQKANHWHVEAQTIKKSKAVRIAAVMAVFGNNERFNVKLQKEDGWFGAKAEGDFGHVEGWIRIDHVDNVPDGYVSFMRNRRVQIIGRSRDGQGIFFL
jgi:hypothetical protein